MPRLQNKLTAKKIKTLAPGTHGDGGGLWLRVAASGSAQWLFRFHLQGKSHQMGLGSYPTVGLAKARLLRDEAAALVADGIDPIRKRQQDRHDAQTELITLAEVAEAAFEARKSELKEGGKAGRWFGPLRNHVLPKIGAIPLVDITQIHIRDAVAPIWHEKADTARKAMNRLSITMNHGAALGLDVDLQAVAKARQLVGKQDHSPQNIPAMPWQEVPEFFATLNEDTLTNIAMKLTILNPGPRSKPLRHLREDHISGDVWTVPGELMKGQKGKVKDWKTPLAPQSLELIEAARHFAHDGNLFPNISGRGVMSDATLSRHMERADLPYRPHGFRSSFRTWAAETGQRHDIAELCLAHKIFGAVESAYVRTDFMDERRQLMNAWADYVVGKVVGC